jgi:hypothetical protein
MGDAFNCEYTGVEILKDRINNKKAVSGEETAFKILICLIFLGR